MKKFIFFAFCFIVFMLPTKTQAQNWVTLSSSEDSIPYGIWKPVSYGFANQFGMSDTDIVNFMKIKIKLLTNMAIVENDTCKFPKYKTKWVNRNDYFYRIVDDYTEIDSSLQTSIKILNINCFENNNYNSFLYDIIVEKNKLILEKDGVYFVCKRIN